MNISTRGDVILNILDEYKDAENLLIENYPAIGYRDLATCQAGMIRRYAVE
ncbi:MAG: hypothetical protein ACQES0_06690 [Bacteroidota bacterium]